MDFFKKNFGKKNLEKYQYSRTVELYIDTASVSSSWSSFLPKVPKEFCVGVYILSIVFQNKKKYKN